MILTLLLFTNLANAQDYAPIKKGQVSPIDGTVLSQNALANIITTNDAVVLECQAKAKHDLEKQTIECELDVQKLEYDLEAIKRTNASIIEAKDEEINKLQTIIKKNNRNLAPLWIAVGFAGGIATTYGTFYLLSE